jgi:hypothetical protein
MERVLAVMILIWGMSDEIENNDIEGPIQYLMVETENLIWSQ